MAEGTSKSPRGGSGGPGLWFVLGGTVLLGAAAALALQVWPPDVTSAGGEANEGITGTLALLAPLLVLALLLIGYGRHLLRRQ